MANNPLFQILDEMKRSFMEEGTLNSHFNQIEDLEDETHPNFLGETLDEYFEGASEAIQIIETELGKPNPDFSLMDRTLHELKGCSITVGAPEVTTSIVQLQEWLRIRNLENGGLCFRRLKEKQASLERKLTEYLNIRNQTRPEEIEEPYEMDDDDSE